MIFNVAGTSFENRQHYLMGAARRGISRVTLVREPGNPYDPNAIKVMTYIGDKRVPVGFVPKEIAREMAPQMDNGRYVNVTAAEVCGGKGLSYGLRIAVDFTLQKKPA